MHHAIRVTTYTNLARNTTKVVWTSFGVPVASVLATHALLGGDDSAPVSISTIMLEYELGPGKVEDAPPTPTRAATHTAMTFFIGQTSSPRIAL